MEKKKALNQKRRVLSTKPNAYEELEEKINVEKSKTKALKEEYLSSKNLMISRNLKISMKIWLQRNLNYQNLWIKT